MISLHEQNVELLRLCEALETDRQHRLHELSQSKDLLAAMERELNNTRNALERELNCSAALERELSDARKKHTETQLLVDHLTSQLRTKEMQLAAQSTIDILASYRLRRSQKNELGRGLADSALSDRTRCQHDSQSTHSFSSTHGHYDALMRSERERMRLDAAVADLREKSEVQHGFSIFYCTSCH